MKGFVFVLLCALVAVQGRYTALEARPSAELGDAPYVVHLRIAVRTSGNLNTCTGSLIGVRWVLTSASCIADASFIWIRYGVVNVINPSLVTETSQVLSNNKLGLININRNVEDSGSILPVSLDGVPNESATYCAFGGDSAPGENLSCSTVGISKDEDGDLTIDDVEASRFDNGAALVSNGVQIAVQTGVEDSAAEFTAVKDYLTWISQVTGIWIGSGSGFVPEIAPEPVNFV